MSGKTQEIFEEPVEAAPKKKTRKPMSEEKRLKC